MTSLYLRTLGLTEIESAEGPISLSSREAALLAFLCSRPSSRATRSEIAEVFWPDVESSKSRHSLSQLLYALRLRVPTNLLVTSGDNVAVAGCQADFIELSTDLREGRMLDALRRYQGRFLPKDDLCSDQLRDWRDNIEAEAADAVGHALQEQSFTCANADLAPLIALAREVLTIHPALAPAQVALLEGHARLGHSHEVIRAHARFTQEGPAGHLPPVTSFLGRRASPQQVDTVRFAGREAELQALQKCWADVEAGTGNVAVILGEPGIGKTRLADHFLRRVAIRGGVTWIARCCAATQRLPYSVVGEFIRDNVAHTDITELLSPPSEHSLSETASDEKRHRLTEKLTSLVLKRCAGQPLVIFVDDAQWVDDYTALLLSYWAYRLRSQRVLILLTVRTEEAEPPSDWIFSDLGRVNELQLSRISIEAASDIVQSFESGHGIQLEKELRDAVLWQSGGRPFLLLEGLSSIMSADTACKPTAESVLTESAESVLRRRFRGLTPEADNVLSALAVWGQEIHGGVLSGIVGVCDEAFAAALNLLHNRGIANWDRGIVSFPHDLMREAAYRNVLPATRALYHRRAAEEISRVGGPVGLTAQHYARAGDSYLAAGHALRAADEAISAHLYSDYEYYCNLCIEYGSEQQQRVGADKLSRYLVRVGRTAEIEGISRFLQEGTPDHALLVAISNLERLLAVGDCQVADLLDQAKAIIAMAGSMNDLTAAPVVATLIDIAFDAGADEFGLHVIDALLPAPDADPVSEAQIAIESILAVWRGVTENIDVGLRKAEAALARLSPQASPTTQALCLASCGTLLLLCGRISEARSHFEAALELAAAAGDLRRQLAIINNNGIALLESGDTEGARHSFERVLTTPNVHSRIRGYGNLAILHYERGDLANAVRAAESVLSMNAAYKSAALDILGHSILGLSSLTEDIELAREHGEHVSALVRGNRITSGDATYPTLLLVKLLLHDGRQVEAMTMLDETVSHVQNRDILCALRLKCERASIVASAEVDRGFALVRDVISESSNRGASLIEERARGIRRDLVNR